MARPFANLQLDMSNCVVLKNDTDLVVGFDADGVPFVEGPDGSKRYDLRFIAMLVTPERETHLYRAQVRT